MIEIYKNKKNGNLYKLLHRATDCTNSRDGTSVIVYSPLDNPEHVSVREEVEFYLKFELAQH